MINKFFRIIVEWALSPASVPIVHDPYVCGKISGYVLRYPRDYVSYWPEYEGKSSWEVGFNENKKGCGANLRTLTLVMSWPDMKSARSMNTRSSGFRGVFVTIRPLLFISQGVGQVRRTALQFLTPDQIRNTEYRSDLGLYHVRGYGSLMDEKYSDFYWGERDGKINHVIYCLWSNFQQKISKCRASFLIPELEAFVEVDFPFEEINSWHGYVTASADFLKNGLIGSE